MALQEEFEHQGLWLFRYRSWLPSIMLPFVVWLYVSKETSLSLCLSFVCMCLYTYFCLFVSFFGLAIRIIAVGYTPENTSGRNTKAGQVADSINKNGIYSIVRRPLYLGNFFMWLGVALLTENIWFWVLFALLYWIYYERIMFAEEQFLRGKFCQSYLQWANKVPAFIPSFKHYEKPCLPMSWKKVLKKEKNGFCAILIIFSGLDLLGYFFNSLPDYNLGLLIAAIVSLIIYFVLKYLKKRTTLLNEAGR